MRVLELYSGIGGMHFALKECGLGEVVAAVDINTTANAVYRHNFQNTKVLQRNIQSFTPEEVNNFNIDMILMSPPCQPFTRVGLKKDITDNRTCSFLHLLHIFPHLTPNWKYLLLENVKGFENSDACQQLLKILEEIGFIYQQFILSPSMFSVPNTRHRYYIIAKRRPLNFIFPVHPDVMENLPVTLHVTDDSRSIYERISAINLKYKNLIDIEKEFSENSCFSINTILENEKPGSYFEEYLLPDKVLKRHAWLLDIVGPTSHRSCCFTKAYGHYVEGTGSVFCPASPKEVAEVYDKSVSYPAGSSEQLNLLKSLKLRYFTPREVSRLMCFPEKEFSFSDDIRQKQRYRLLGNSINVHVVSLLIMLMTSEDSTGRLSAVT